MHIFKKFVLPGLVILITVLVMCIFKSVPSSKLWKGYTVLYVPVNTDNYTVCSVLENCGCHDFISLSNQRIPFVNDIVPVSDFYDYEYVKTRNDTFFYDKTKSFVLFYIPDVYYRYTQKSCKVLFEEYGINACLDSKSSFPFISPLLCLVVFVILLFFSKNRLFYFLSGIFAVLMAFSLPFYAQAACLCVYLYLLYLVQYLWGRHKALERLMKLPHIYVLLGLSLIGSCILGWKNGLWMVLCIAAGLSSSWLLWIYESWYTSRLRFQPVKIIPAWAMNPLNKYNTTRAIFPLGAVFFLFILYISNINIFPISNFNDLFFPCPVGYNSKDGQDCFDNYYYYRWAKMTAPYRSLNEGKIDFPKDNEVCSSCFYVRTETGVTVDEKKIAVFDNAFKKDSLNQIQNFDYPAVEKLMVCQGKAYKVGWSAGYGEKFSIQAMITFYMILISSVVFFILKLTGRRADDSFSRK